MYAIVFRSSTKAAKIRIEQLAGDCICITSKGKPIKPKTIGQKKYCTTIANNTITIGVGLPVQVRLTLRLLWQ